MVFIVMCKHNNNNKSYVLVESTLYPIRLRDTKHHLWSFNREFNKEAP